MIDWDNITDEEMRAGVISNLTSGRDDMVRQAARNERDASDRGRRTKDRLEDAACAKYSRRQAAHFQQAIDLLTAAPMPEQASAAED